MLAATASPQRRGGAEKRRENHETVLLRSAPSFLTFVRDCAEMVKNHVITGRAFSSQRRIEEGHERAVLCVSLRLRVSAVIR
jgi:hypothetical protein